MRVRDGVSLRAKDWLDFTYSTQIYSKAEDRGFAKKKQQKLYRKSLKISEFSSAFKRIYDIAQFVIETLPRPPTS